MAGSSFSVHGESITDGDSSSGVAVILYDSGSVEVRALKSTEVLHITDMQIYNETGGDTWLVVDAKEAGRYIVFASFDAKGGIVHHFSKPFVCPKGVVPKLFGAASNINSCLIEGFISEA